MRISDRLTFVYIAPARSGSTSLRNALDDFSDVFSCHVSEGSIFHHIDYETLEKYHPRIQNYKKFTIMRDPFERTKSLFYHHLRETDGFIKFIARGSIALAKILFWTKRIFVRGALCAEVTSQISKDFVVFRLEDKDLVAKLNDYLNIKIKKIGHANKIKRDIGDTDHISVIFTYLLFRRDVALYAPLNDACD